MAAVSVVQHHADADVVDVKCPEVDRSKMDLALVVAKLFNGEVAGELFDGSQRESTKLWSAPNLLDACSW